MPPDYVARRAVTLLASRPDRRRDGRDASRPEPAGIGDFVAVDMGGTSFDICLVRDGQPEIKTDWNWRYRYYIGLPMVDVQSVGAGGGSIARVRQGALLVGPESAGSAPGPGVLRPRRRRGRRVTDADAVLGYLPVDGFAGGRMHLDVDAPRDRDPATHVAEPLGIDVTEAAWGIERIVNANMANATRKVLAGHGADPRDLALIAYGGNGAVHACGDRARARRRPDPRAEGRARVLARSACSSPTTSSTSCARTSLPLSQVDLGRVRDAHDRAAATRSTRSSSPTGRRRGRRRARPVRADVLPGPELRHERAGARGRRARRARPARPRRALPRPARGRARASASAPSSRCVRGVRVIARGHHAEARPPRGDRHASPTPSQARSGTRPAYWGDGFVDTPVYDGTRLGDGRDGRRARADRGAVHRRGAAARRDRDASTTSATTSSRCDAASSCSSPTSTGTGSGTARSRCSAAGSSTRSTRCSICSRPTRASASCSTGRRSCSRTTSRCGPHRRAELVAGTARRPARGRTVVRAARLAPARRRDARAQPAARPRGRGRARAGVDRRLRPRLVRASRAAPPAPRRASASTRSSTGAATAPSSTRSARCTVWRAPDGIVGARLAAARGLLRGRRARRRRRPRRHRRAPARR